MFVIGASREMFLCAVVQLLPCNNRCPATFDCATARLHDCTIEDMLLPVLAAAGAVAVSGESRIRKELFYGSALDNGGRCLDGSAAGFYLQPADPAGPLQSTWVIFLEGGGACYTKEKCESRAKYGLGSSTRWPEGRWPKDFDLARDPSFAGANHVFVPYCSGDEHAGTRTTASAETWGLYFSGHLGLRHALDRLKRNNGLGAANSSVLLTGQSAGAVGTFLNADYVQAQLPNATVKAAPNAGWFFPGDDRALPHGVGIAINFADWTATPQRFTDWSNASGAAELWDSYVPPACKSAMVAKGLDPRFCMSVHNLYQYISVPVLVLENQFDEFQLSRNMGLPPTSPGQKAKVDAYMAYYGRLMRNSTAQVLQKEGDGLFLASCFTHIVNKKVTVQGYTHTQLLGDWFFGRGAIPAVLIDPCKSDDGTPCGTGCAKADDEDDGDADASSPHEAP